MCPGEAQGLLGWTWPGLSGPSSLGAPPLLLSASRRHDDSGALERVRCYSRKVICVPNDSCERRGAGLGSNSARVSSGSRHFPLVSATSAHPSRVSPVYLVLHHARNVTHAIPASQGVSEALGCGLGVYSHACRPAQTRPAMASSSLSRHSLARSEPSLSAIASTAHARVDLALVRPRSLSLVLAVCQVRKATPLAATRPAFSLCAPPALDDLSCSPSHRTTWETTCTSSREFAALNDTDIARE